MRRLRHPNILRVISVRVLHAHARTHTGSRRWRHRLPRHGTCTKRRSSHTYSPRQPHCRAGSKNNVSSVDRSTTLLAHDEHRSSRSQMRKRATRQMGQCKTGGLWICARHGLAIAHILRQSRVRTTRGVDGEWVLCHIFHTRAHIGQGRPYSGCAIDTWSAGIVLYIMVTGSMPYSDRNVHKLIQQQTKRRLGYPSRAAHVSMAVRILIYDMLHPTAEEVRVRMHIHMCSDRGTRRCVQALGWRRPIGRSAPTVCCTCSTRLLTSRARRHNRITEWGTMIRFFVGFCFVIITH
jgi:hypothetical protein